MKMNKLTKKIVAIVTTITCAVWMMGPGVANALTASELQVLIDDLMAQIVSLQSQLSAIEGGEVAVAGCSITSFDRALKVGMSGDDVNCLQIVLNTASDTQLADSGVGSPGNETSYFGPLTKAGVIKFQEKYASEILASWGLTAGTGFVGSTTRTKLNSLLSAGVGEEEEEEPVTGVASVSLAVTTPEAVQVALNAQDALFTKIRFTGGDEGVTITKIYVRRGGIGADSDLASIKLYDGTTQLGSTQALNTVTHKASFSGLNWEIPAGTAKYLTIKGSIAAEGTAQTGNSLRLGIVAVSDITSTGTLTGTFPIYGNAKTIAGISVGYLSVDEQVTPATSTILSGSVDQEIASWRFISSSTFEGFYVHSVKVTHVGSATADDVMNLKLKVSGVQIGDTIASLDAQNQAIFDLSDDPLHIRKGASKTIYAYADVAAGIWTARTIIFEITQYTDVTAYGDDSGGAVTITCEGGVGDYYSSYTKQTGNEMEVGQGTLTVNVDASLNPAAQTYVKGTENRLMSAFKFTTGSREGVRIVKLKLMLDEGIGSATDLSNITLWDGSTMIAGPASLIGSYVSFGANTIGWDVSGLFDIEKSDSKTIQVKADVPTGATANTAAIDLDINAYSDIWADGLESQYDIEQTSSNIVLTSGEGNAHTIADEGNLAVSKSAQTPAAQTYIKGSTGQEFLRLNLTADSGEDMIVTSIIFELYTSADVAAAAGDLTNVKAVKSDGSQFGATRGTPGATAAFSGTLNVPASETVTLKVIADIPITTAFDADGGYIILTDAEDMTSTGAASGQDITETGFTVQGNTMAVGEGALVISAAAVPGDQTKIIGSTDVSMVGLVFTAGAAEDIRVTRIKITGHSTGNGAVEDLSRMALYQGSTILTTRKGWDSNATTVTFSASDFLNSSGIDINQGQQKIITVKADIPSTGVAGNVMAFGIVTSTDGEVFTESTTSDVTFVGLDSNSNPDATLSFDPNLEGVNYSTGGNAPAHYVTLSAEGRFTVDVSADTPEVAMLAIGPQTAGKDGVVFAKFDFKSALEDVDIKAIEIERNFGTSTFDNLYSQITLWEGDTQVGGAQTLVNRGLSWSSTTFNLPSGSYWRLTAGETRTLTVKADLNGIMGQYADGVRPGDASKLCIAGITNDQLKVTGVGVSSGITMYASSTSAALNDACGNEQIPYQSKPTIASASLPSTVYGAGEKVLYRWTVTADDQGDIAWQKIVFDVSGSVSISGTSYTIGLGTDADPSVETTNVLLMGTSTTAADNTPKSLITATSTIKVYNVATNQEVTASSGSAWTNVDNQQTAGGARIVFISASEQIVAAGQTKTYELRGALAYGGAAGDSISTKIASRGTATSTNTFYYIANGADGDADEFATSTGHTFIWSDKSGAGGTHSDTSYDWTHDYKVTGIPTATLSLTK